jgi:GT2 family glycosyltransferase
MEVSVTALIPVWNGRELLMKLLDTLDRQTAPVDEILIVDNGSNDGAPEAAEQRGARVIRLGRNFGFAHAVNRGVGESQNELIAILNTDVELDPGWLAALLAADAPFACGTMLSAANPHIVDGSFDLLSRGGCPWRAGHGATATPTSCAIDMASFTAVVFRRELFLKIGLLDERFESYLEDVDFGLRCMANGIGGRYVAGAVCRHRGSAALGRWNAASVRRISRNQLFLVAKHYPRSLARGWWRAILVGQALWGVLAVRHGAGFAWLQGKLQGLRDFRSLPSTPNPALETALRQHEEIIYNLQKKQGMDWYWRVYFALAGDKRHRQPNAR